MTSILRHLHMHASSFQDPDANAAFTLAEVLVAVAIIGISFVSLYAGISYCFGVTRFDQENLRATQIALQRLEGIRLFNWNQLHEPNLNPTTFSEWYFPLTASGVKYTGGVKVDNVPFAASYSGDMKRVTVTVTWTSGNVLRTRSAFTYAARNGIQNYVYAH